MKNQLEFPNGAEFAFSVLDDTDDTTVQNGAPVYELLHDLGIITTKTVWAFDAEPDNRGPYFAGQTLSNPEYKEWVQNLANQGYEIAFHNATMGSSEREDTLEALDKIEDLFGSAVRLHCNHGQNAENLFWGFDRYEIGVLRWALKMATRRQEQPAFLGNDPDSPYFWADIAERRLSYMRAFTYRNLDGRKNPPRALYRSQRMPNGPFLFSTTDAPDVLAFNKRVTKSGIDKLRRENGWAIVSTHFGKGFYARKSINKEFSDVMHHLSNQNGWYVPVSNLLEFLAAQQSPRVLTFPEQLELELRHIFDRVRAKLLDKPLY